MGKKKSVYDEMDSDNESESNIFDTEESPKESENKKKSTKKSSSTETSESTDNKSITFIKLKDDAKTEIRYIYHISDIHIRNTQRHTEYKEVFERTYQKLKKQIGSNKKMSLIVLTGDIMHTKTELSPESFSIAQDFFKALSDIAPVVLIPGNHDCNLSNKDRLDALSPIVAGNVKFDNLHYLKKSGLYQYYNIVFGITSIFDDILIKADRIGSEIWKGIKQKNKYKIALYHGPVHGAKTDVGYRMNNEQLLAEDFDGYDYVMLGDIHKYQYMNDNETIAYAGSLIQQSYGESLSGHGVLKWDLLDGESELMEIKNDYGYCTIRIVDGKMVDTTIPRKPRVRFILENTNQIQYQEILNSLEKEYQICEIVRESNFKTKLHNNSPSQKKIKEEVTAYATQESIIKAYLTKKGLEKEKIQGLINLHKKIYQKILADKKDQVVDTMHNSTKTQKWKLLELRFSNTLSYGKDNVIDFRKYDPNKIIGIVAPNHYGKSAILDIILFCLFDKFSRGERRDILNKNEKTMYCSLLLSVGSQKYLIERIGQRNKNGLTVKIDVNFYSIKEEKGKEIKEKLNGIDKNDTNKKIVELIGDYNDYLTTCFCLQQGKSSNFIDMTQLQKKEYLNEILKLNVFEDCHNMAKDKLKQLTGQLKLLEQKVGTKSLDEIKQNIKTTTSEIKRLELLKYNTNLTLAEELEYILSNLSKSTLTKYNELSEYDLTTEKSIISTIENIRNELKKEMSIDLEKVKKELAENKSKLIELENAEDEKQNNGQITDIKELLDQKEELIKKLINIPKNFNVNDIDKIKKEKEDAEIKIKTIDKTLKNYKTDNLSDKISRIDELKSIITNLRKTLKPVNENCETILADLKSKLAENEDKILSLINKTFENTGSLTVEEKEELLKKLQIKKVFAQHLKNNVQELQKYKTGFFDKNDEIVSFVMDRDNEWIKRYNIWSTKVNKLLETQNSDEPSLDYLIRESRNLTKKIMLASVDVFDTHDNNIIMKKIRIAEEELDSLSEFRGTKKEIDNLNQEKKLLQDKINILENKLNDIDTYQKHLESNLVIQKQIDELQLIIDKQTEESKKINKLMKDIKNKISECENIISDHKKQIKESKKLKVHLKLMEEYYMLYLDWCQKNDYLKRWTKIKKEFDDDLNAITKEIEKKQIELAIHKKDVEQYLEHRKDFDDKSTETNLYQLYVQVMNYNGLPYEMLKTYLPLIEADVNQILHSMVNFNIEFMFYDESHLEEQKTKQLKSNMGCVDINICYQDMKPYNVQLASGFERFIIGLAIRMTLCQISLTAKPNFLIIDEGWSCLDSENLGNVGTIMNYIKTQYEHIIIISHLEELKNQADHVINIEKNNGYSCIKTDNKLLVNRKKKKNIKKVIEI
ncbi:putative DNA repair protein [Tupanvirus deep ocean]|uniref:DNA repair protein n=2 Tax=Tupanvirus TaxID=2094720 RepID=A0AC62A7A7_9VIRU|nr:putative DNA repair protein [Tupanvirus deep ocean]QKU33661.1 putative DNA repair protein [Tupanvirus deep ocean]